LDFRGKLPLLYDQLRSYVNNVLGEDLPSCTGIAVTTDLWTSKANDSFMSLTLHYIIEKKDPKFPNQTILELKSLVLHCIPFDAPSHTALAIGRALDKVVGEIPGLQVDTMRIAVHDSGANVKAAIPKSTEITESLLCMDHLINLVLKLKFLIKTSYKFFAIRDPSNNT
jgi:hypothetical protein